MDIKTKGLEKMNEEEEEKKNGESLEKIEKYILVGSIAVSISIAFFIQDTKVMYYLSLLFGA